MIHSISKELNPIQLPFHEGKVTMLPFDLSDLKSVPFPFRATAKEMIQSLPKKVGTAFLTVHGKLVEKANTLRRGLPHIDGNYIPRLAYWPNEGGGGNGWKVGENGNVLDSKEHKLSYETETGGFLIASNHSACMGWNGTFEGSPNKGGDCSHIELGKGFMLKANKIYYGNSRFIHESLPVKKDVHRIMYRITLPSDYQRLN